MLHNVDLILTLAGGLSAALVLGFITQKLRMSPIVGYLLAGIIVGPYSPGFRRRCGHGFPMRGNRHHPAHVRRGPPLPS